MSKKDIDELVRWRDKCESIARMLQQATRERDEAVERCKTLRELADAASHEQGLAQRRMMEAQRERDEARAEVERLRALLKTVSVEFEPEQHE